MVYFNKLIGVEDRKLTFRGSKYIQSGAYDPFLYNWYRLFLHQLLFGLS